MKTKVTLKYFAMLRDHTKKSEEEIEGTFSNAHELFELICSNYQVKLDKSQFKVAINECYEDFNTVLENGDTVAFIPPVAGG